MEFRPERAVIRDVETGVLEVLLLRAVRVVPEVLEQGAVEVEDIALAGEACLRSAGEERDLVVMVVRGDRGADLRGVRRELEAERDEGVEDPVSRLRLRQVEVAERDDVV